MSTEHTRATIVSILEANGFSRRDLHDLLGDLNLVDRIALAILPQEIDYSFAADEVVDLSVNPPLTRARQAAIEAYKHALAFVQLKRERDGIPSPNLNHLRACKATMVELVRLKTISELIDSGDATPEQILDYEKNKLIAWENAKKLSNA